MNHNIELVRYMRFGDDLLLLEQVNAVSASADGGSTSRTSGVSHDRTKRVSDDLENADQQLKDRYESVQEFLVNLGDDVQVKALKYYFAFKRIKNFACIWVQARSRNLLLYVKVDPETVQLEKDFTRDVRNIGHFGTGDLEITIKSAADFEKSKPLLERSYESA